MTAYNTHLFISDCRHKLSILSSAQLMVGIISTDGVYRVISVAEHEACEFDDGNDDDE